MKYKVMFSSGGAGKMQEGEVLNEYSLCAGQTPRFGYYWWMWIPEFRMNGGSIFRKETVDINFHWLRWWCAVTMFPVNE